MKKRKKTHEAPKEPTQAEIVRAYIRKGVGPTTPNTAIADALWAAKDRALLETKPRAKTRRGGVE